MISSILISVLGFLLTIAILVAFHEYGHFWAARRMGVRVKTFSIGFGRTLYSRRFGADQTEFRVALWPLGGYVRMLDEREGPVDAAEQHRAFNRLALRKRAFVVAAGPIANILLALLFWWLMFMVGVQAVVPKLGDLPADSAFKAAGLERGDLITEVDGKPVESIADLRLALLDAAINRDQATLVYQRDHRMADTQMAFNGLNPLDGRIGETPRDILQSLGFAFYNPASKARIEAVVPDSPAAQAGLESGDVVTRIDGQGYFDASALIEQIGNNPDQAVILEIERDGRVLEQTITPQPEQTENGTVGRIGVQLSAVPENPDEVRDLFITQRFGPIEGVTRSLDRSWEMTTLTYQVFARLITGQASISNLSGPISIADYAGQSLLLGLSTYLGFLALISLSLAILNLLPVPMLDGGHLLMYLIEAVKGSPVSEVAQERAARIGLALLGTFMILVFYNDILRLMN